VGDEPPFTAVAVSVTEVDGIMWYNVDRIELPTARLVFTTIAGALAVTGFPVTQGAFDVIVHDITSPLAAVIV
jgi:hypothetical protein